MRRHLPSTSYSESCSYRRRSVAPYPQPTPTYAPFPDPTCQVDPTINHDQTLAPLQENIGYEPANPNNPFSPFCRIPLPNPYGGGEFGAEPAFIRKRNERERERVRCVNDGYARLRQHVPNVNKDKRVSKVETLRAAIDYIEHLQTILGGLNNSDTPSSSVKCKKEQENSVVQEESST